MAITEHDLGPVRGDINDSVATFTAASTRANIASGDTGKTIFGKISKWFADLKTAAFCTVVNNFTTTTANTVADGRALKTLKDQYDELNRNIENMTFKDFSSWGNLSPGDLSTTTRRFSNTNVSSVREFVFVLYQGGNGSDTIYEYVHISTPFGDLMDGYYVANSISGQLKIYYSKSGKLVDIYALPATLKQICYR